MSEENPWKTLSSKTVYENAWIKVREDAVVCPDGSKGIYGVVETRIATGVVAMTPENEIFLVGQYRYPLDSYSWEIIEGGSDPQESPLQAAKRELKEEAGIVASQWEQLGGVVHLSNCHSSEEGYIFLAKDLEFFEAEPDATEILKIKKLPLSEALEMLDSGVITDGMSVIALERLRNKEGAQ
jgi:8-oxo-dGTP pyrophosphatase MutT (NUDIX family)